MAIAAERGTEKIAVEIQSFLNPSSVRDLQEATGQYAVYREILAEIDTDRVIYLAVPRRAYEGIFTDRLGQLIVSRLGIKLLVFDENRKGVIKWIA